MSTTSDYTYGEQVALALLPKISGFVSVCCSCYIIYNITSSKQLRSKPYERLICGISIVDALSSFSFGLGTWPVPATPNILWSAGNHATCQAQAFMNQIAIGSPLYSGMLSIYYVLTINYSWKQYQMERIEWIFHAIPLCWALGTAIAGLVLDIYGGAILWCGSGSQHDIYRWIFFYGPLWLMIVVVTVNCVFIYCHVRKVEKSASRWNVQRQSKHNFHLKAEAAAAAAAAAAVMNGSSSCSSSAIMVAAEESKSSLFFPKQSSSSEQQIQQQQQQKVENEREQKLPIMESEIEIVFEKCDNNNNEYSDTTQRNENEEMKPRMIMESEIEITFEHDDDNNHYDHSKTMPKQQHEQQQQQKQQLQFGTTTTTTTQVSVVPLHVPQHNFYASSCCESEITFPPREETTTTTTTTTAAAVVVQAVPEQRPPPRPPIVSIYSDESSSGTTILVAATPPQHRSSTIMAQKRNNRRRSRMVATQSFLYAGAFYLNWTAVTVTRIIGKVNGHSYFPLLLLAAVTVPMYGLPNIMVYMYPRMIQASLQNRRHRRTSSRMAQLRDRILQHNMFGGGIKSSAGGSSVLNNVGSCNHHHHHQGGNNTNRRSSSNHHNQHHHEEELESNSETSGDDGGMNNSSNSSSSFRGLKISRWINRFSSSFQMNQSSCNSTSGSNTKNSRPNSSSSSDSSSRYYCNNSKPPQSEQILKDSREKEEEEQQQQQQQQKQHDDEQQHLDTETTTHHISSASDHENMELRNDNEQQEEEDEQEDDEEMIDV